MICKKCGKEIKDGNSFCVYCGNNIENQSNSKKINKKMLIIISIILCVIFFIIGICCLFSKNKQHDNQNLINLNQQEQQEQQENQDKQVQENKIRFKNTSDLEKFSNTATLSSGKEMTVTGLDLVFVDALEYKFPTIQTGNGGNLYTSFLTALGPSDIKGFIINDDIIGGYAIYYNYNKGTESQQEGYYLYYQTFAVKVTNWEGLNNLRNIIIFRRGYYK